MGFANKNFPSFSKTPGSFWADAIWYFPSDQGFIGHFLRDCLCLNLQGCSVVWVWTSRGAARKQGDVFTFPRYFVILELGGAPLYFPVLFVCDWGSFIWYLASRNKALDAALTVGMPCELPTWPNICQTFLIGFLGVWMRCIALQLPLPSAPSFSGQVAWMS